MALCSPLLVETVVWFLERWSKTYLFPSTRDSETFSHNLLGAYGQNSPRGKAVIGFLVEKLDLVFMGWRAQEDVLKELARLLETLSMHQHIRGEILRSTQWMGLMQNVVNNLHILPSEVQSSLIEHLCRMASGAEQTSVQTHFITLLTNVAETRLRSLLGPDFTKMAQRGESIAQLIVCFEMFRGVAMASDGSNFEIIFSFSASYFDSFVKLMDYYHNFPEVVLVIFKFYNSFIECQLPYLNTKQMDVVFRSILSLFQVYASKNAGKNSLTRFGSFLRLLWTSSLATYSNRSRCGGFAVSSLDSQPRQGEKKKRLSLPYLARAQPSTRQCTCGCASGGTSASVTPSGCSRRCR